MGDAFGQRRNNRRRYLFLFLSESLVLCLLWAVFAGPDLDTPSSLHRLLQKMRKGMLRRHAHAPAAARGNAVHSLRCAAVQLLFCARRLCGCSHVLPAISFLIVPLAAVAWLCRVTGAGLGCPGGLRHYFLFFLWRLLPPILKEKKSPNGSFCVPNVFSSVPLQNYGYCCVLRLSNVTSGTPEIWLLLWPVASTENHKGQMKEAFLLRF